MNYLVDVNLPKKFCFFNTPEFDFVVDLQATLPDTEIWAYALKNEPIILTKDADFYTRAVMTVRRSKIIQFKLANQTLAGLHHYFETNWPLLTGLIETHSLLVVYPNRVDIIF